MRFFEKKSFEVRNETRGGKLVAAVAVADAVAVAVAMVVAVAVAVATKPQSPT